MRQRTMIVVGIFNLGLGEAEKGLVFINLADAQTLYNLRGQATEVTISLYTLGMEEQVIGDLQASLGGYEVDSWLTLNPALTESLALSQQMVTIFGFILIMIACIGILNLMMMAVFERTREMGVLAALGLKGRQIMGLFLLEGTLIGLVGVVLGCFLGLLLLGVVGQVGIDLSFASGMGEVGALMGDRLYPSVTLGGVVSRGVAVALIAMLASLYPAWQAARQEPAEALHHI